MQLRCYTKGMSLPNVKFYQWKRRGKKILFIIAMIFAVLVLLLGLSLVDFGSLAKKSASSIFSGFKDFGSQLTALQSEEARSSLMKIKEDINNIKSHPAVAFWSGLIPKMKNAPEMFNDLNNLASTLDLVNNGLERLKGEAFNLLVNKQGIELIKQLEELSRNIITAEEMGINLKKSMASLNVALGEDVSLDAEIYKAKQFLGALIFWLNQPETQNVVILFQNPTEIRPGGGFAGSYAEIGLGKGSLTNIKVNDIYYPDKFLSLKIVPPKPLQLITPNWGARDAAWFFDFPTSARKTIEFLEASDIYKKQSTRFSAVIALNVNVIKSILEVIGAIDLSDYGLVIDKDNFLAEIQREVEAGDDKRAGDPKRILKVMTPIFFERLAALNDEQKNQLFKKFQQHLSVKDIMFFFHDPVLEGYIKNVGFGGDVLNLPKTFSGDYLAVVNANIGGGKSDAFVSQKIRLDSKIDLNGTVNNYLTVERAHTGQDQEDWWYRSVNKNYIQVLAPMSAVLDETKGNVYRFVKAPINYKVSGYKNDVDLKAIEITEKFLDDFAVEELFQFGKKTFATWFDVKAGEKKKLELKYKNANAISVVNGVKYRFIFDKQAGVNGGLELHIEAPPGYKWWESDSHLFSYLSENVPARVILDLTLKEEKQTIK